MNEIIYRFVLVLVRTTSFIVICPGFSYKGLSNIFKVALSMVLSFLIVNTIPEMEVIDDIYYLLFMAIEEALLGLAMGYITKLVFAVIEIAGQMVDFQVGFSMASVYDPAIGINASNYGRVYYWLSICVFFILDMHHKVLWAMINSFKLIPIGNVNFTGNGVEGVVRLFTLSFELALNLAAPLIIVVLVTDVVLGIISRTVPQINVLMLGMPLKSMISFFATLIMLSWLIGRIGTIISTMPGYLEDFLNLFMKL
ncbi:MAG: flagellar biosynthetic protein FliR [Tissierellaceae bacterium]|nr:flagellar biosynthetic protein FliR [Tissierellaceae bacterium]